MKIFSLNWFDWRWFKRSLLKGIISTKTRNYKFQNTIKLLCQETYLVWYFGKYYEMVRAWWEGMDFGVDLLVKSTWTYRDRKCNFPKHFQIQISNRVYVVMIINIFWEKNGHGTNIFQPNFAPNSIHFFGFPTFSIFFFFNFQGLSSLSRIWVYRLLSGSWIWAKLIFGLIICTAIVCVLEIQHYFLWVFHREILGTKWFTSKIEIKQPYYVLKNKYSNLWLDGDGQNQFGHSPIDSRLGIVGQIG